MSGLPWVLPMPATTYLGRCCEVCPEPIKAGQTIVQDGCGRLAHAACVAIKEAK